MSDPFDFDDLAPIEIPVRIAGVAYILREASEAAACKWRNHQLKATRMADGKVTGMDGMADAEPLLVSLCLCQTNPDGTLKLDPQRNPANVPLALVLSWPARIVKPLFEKAKEISDLTEKETADALEKRLLETREKLDKLRAGENREKNLPNGSTDSFALLNPSASTSTP